MIVGLGGGIGASRLWRALVQAVVPEDLTLVVNTGDDLWLHGLRVCPDLDTTLYALSGRQDAERGWGLADESFRCMEELRGLGHRVWFNVGDRDLATHLLRTSLLGQGLGLAEVTRRLAAAMGVGVRVLPMTEQEVTTRVLTGDGRRLHYEEFLVRERARPRVAGVAYEGAERARPAPGVLAAIAGAELVVLAPSNPLASIAPILRVPGVREAVAACRPRVVAVAPIVARVPISDPGEAQRAASRAALLASLGLPAVPSAVAGMYKDICRRFVLDPADAAETGALQELGLEVAVAPTLLARGASGELLCAAILATRPPPATPG